MADMENFYDDLMIINLYHSLIALLCPIVKNSTLVFFLNQGAVN